MQKRPPVYQAEVKGVVDSRIDQFRALAGLYPRDSAETLSEFRESELRSTIVEADRTEGEPRVEVFRIFDVLRESKA